MEATQYDSALAERYARTKRNQSPLQLLAYQSFVRAVGNVDDKKVCDLGCGAGYSTRLLAGLGSPAYLAGIDNSKEQIMRACATEKFVQMHIHYKQADCSRLVGPRSWYDLVTAMWLLHYAQDEVELCGFGHSAYRLLKRGGRFVAVVQDKFEINPQSTRFGEQREWIGTPGQEGSEQKITLFDEMGQETADFRIHCWSRERYVSALANAGFSDIRWEGLQFDEEKRQFFPEWQTIQSVASCSILTARRR